MTEESDENMKQKAEEMFIKWKSEQYNDQSTEDKLEFVEHLHCFPTYFQKTFIAGVIEATKEFESCLEDTIKCKNPFPNICWKLICDANDKLKERIKKMKICANCHVWLMNEDAKNCLNCPTNEGIKLLKGDNE